MLQKKDFPICEEYIDLINKGFNAGGWMTLFHDRGIYAVMVDDDRLQVEEQCDNWAVNWATNRPSFGYDDGGTVVDDYKPWPEEGVYPIVITQETNCYYAFNARLIDELVLFYNLHAVYRVDGTIEYYLIDENSDDVLVAKSSSEYFIIKTDYIKEFIAIKKLHLLIQFDEVVYSSKSLAEQGLKQTTAKLYNDKDVVLSYALQDAAFSDDHKSCAVIRGKFAIHPDVKNIKRLWDYEERKYESFIIGADSEGNEIESTCEERLLPPFTSTPPSIAYQLSLVFFEDKVLEKYYKDSRKYSVRDGSVEGPNWFAHLDDDHDDGYVVMVLKDLGHLPYKEQLHWKKYNVAPPKGISMSDTTWKRWFAGEPCDPSHASDIVFKSFYHQLNKTWKEKFGFALFLPLAPGDQHFFDGIHNMTELNNDGDLDEFVLSITKVVIDSLNESGIAKLLDDSSVAIQKYLKQKNIATGKVKDLSGGLNRLEALFLQNEINGRKFMTLLRKIQALRSAVSAHRKKMELKNKDLALYAWFGYDKNPHKDVINTILNMLNLQMQWMMDELKDGHIFDSRSWFRKIADRISGCFK